MLELFSRILGREVWGLHFQKMDARQWEEKKERLYIALFSSLDLQ